MDKKKFLVIDEETHQLLKLFAVETNRKLQEIVQTAIVDYLEQFPKQY